MRFQDGVEHRQDWRRHLALRPAPHRGAGERLDFDGLPLLKIDQERRPRGRRNRIDISHDPLDDIKRQCHLLGSGDRLDLAERRHEHVSRHPIRPDRSNRHARGTGERRERRQIAELLPDRHTGVGHRLRNDVGAGKRFVNLTHPFGYPRGIPRGFPEHDATMRAGLFDEAGLGKRGGDVGRAAEHAGSIDGRGDIVHAVDTILKRERDGAVPHDGLEHRQRLGIAVGLHRENRDVDRLHSLRAILGRTTRREVAEDALHREAASANGLQVRAARDKRDVVPCVRELRAEVAADRSGSDDAESHPIRSIVFVWTSRSGRSEEPQMTYYGAKELAASFRTVRANTIQIAEEIPESQYEFSPAPEVRTIGKLLFHISQVPTVTLYTHQNKITNMADVPFMDILGRLRTDEARPRTKDEIVAALKTEGEKFATFIDALSEPFLAEIVAMMPGSQPATKSRLELLLSAKEHEMHHRGQLMLIERMLGIVPHLTRQFQQRMAVRQAAAAKT